MCPLVGSLGLPVTVAAAASPAPVYECLRVQWCRSTGIPVLVSDPVGEGAPSICHCFKSYCPYCWQLPHEGTEGGEHTYCFTQTTWPLWPSSTPSTPGVAPQPTCCVAWPFQVQSDFLIQAVHTPDHLNINADDLSQNQPRVLCHHLLLLSPQPSGSLQNCGTSYYRAPTPGHPDLKAADDLLL